MRTFAIITMFLFALVSSQAYACRSCMPSTTKPDLVVNQATTLQKEKEKDLSVRQDDKNNINVLSKKK